MIEPEAVEALHLQRVRRKGFIIPSAEGAAERGLLSLDDDAVVDTVRWLDDASRREREARRSSA